MFRWLLLLFAVFLSSCFSSGDGERLNVAVASNFTAPMQILAHQFQQQSGISVDISSGSTGQLFTQITQGAPFDVFLSADAHRARILEEKGLIVSSSRFTYATGQLALWSLSPLLFDDLRELDFKYLAIANPKLAPYGAAAIEFMKSLDLYENWQGRLVFGQNIAQAQQFVVAGQAQVAIISLSQAVLWEKENQSGYYQLLDASSYSPIIQQAVQISHSPEAAQLIQFLQSTQVLKQLEQWGYTK